MVKTVNDSQSKTVGGYKHRYRLVHLRRAEMLANVQSELRISMIKLIDVKGFHYF